MRPYSQPHKQIRNGLEPNPMYWRSCRIYGSHCQTLPSTLKAMIRGMIEKNLQYIKGRLPGIAPAAFIIPKTDPGCLGAKSWGFIMTAELWKPPKKRQRLMKNKAVEKLPVKPEGKERALKEQKNLPPSLDWIVHKILILCCTWQRD